MIYSKIIPYKTFELKDLQGKSGHFIYGVDEGSKDYAVEILVFCDSAGNHYLISEKVCETQAEVVIEEWAHGPYKDSDLKSYVETVTQRARAYLPEKGE